MNRARLLALTVCVAASAGIVGALPATAGGPGTPVPKGAKAENGPYKSKLTIQVERARRLFVKVKSTADFPQDATLREQSVGEDADYKFRWFRRNTDISHDAQTSGYDFRLRPDKPRLFRVRVKPLVADPGAACLYTNVTVTNPSTGTNGPFFALNDRNACQA